MAGYALKVPISETFRDSSGHILMYKNRSGTHDAAVINRDQLSYNPLLAERIRCGLRVPAHTEHIQRRTAAGRDTAGCLSRLPCCIKFRSGYGINVEKILFGQNSEYMESKKQIKAILLYTCSSNLGAQFAEHSKPIISSTKLGRRCREINFRK